jgi:hypothetical protein
MDNPYGGAEGASSHNCAKTGIDIISYSSSSGTGTIRVGWICIGF